MSVGEWGFPLPPDPHGLLPPFEAITKSVAAISGSQLPPRRFDDLAVFRSSAVRCRRRSHDSGSFHRFGRPFRASRQRPAGVLRGSSDPHGVLRPYNDINMEIYLSGLPTPVCPAFRVSHPLDGFLPPCLPITRIGAARGVHPPEPFPPAEPYAFGACALMLFLTSHSLALRTRRSRCPAAPRLCSLRRSVPSVDLSPLGPMLSWASLPLRSVPPVSRVRLPVLFPHALPPIVLRRSRCGRYSRALTNTGVARPVRNDQLP